MTPLPREWSRGPQWTSESARDAWEPVLRRAQAAWSELELASITEGVRESALLMVTAGELVQASRDVAGVGLELAVLEASEDGFRVAVHRPGLARRWQAAWSPQRDDDAVGVLLGFPACCRAFFAREWQERGAADVVPAMPTPDGPWEANILLRWLGVRLVPHLPCSGACEETVALARRFLEAGRRAGVDVAALEALLRLPVTYSSLNGLAIVETPHFRLMAAADSNPEVIYRARPGAYEGSVWTDNGFTTLQAMEAAHAVVAEAVGDVGSALDLGCGDGSLLARIARGRRGRWRGVECDPERAARGASRHPGITILCGRIEDPDEDLAALSADVDVVLLMPGRLVEIAPEDAERVRQALRGRRLVVYAYGDWLREGIGALCSRAGLVFGRGPGTCCAKVHEGANVVAGEALVYDPDVHYDGGPA